MLFGRKELKRHLKDVFVLGCGVMFRCSSCAKEKADTVEGKSKIEMSDVVEKVDTSDSGAVARTAWQAIVDEDYGTYMGEISGTSFSCAV